jgi:hypothetical protein
MLEKKYIYLVVHCSILKNTPPLVREVPPINRRGWDLVREKKSPLPPLIRGAEHESLMNKNNGTKS